MHSILSIHHNQFYSMDRAVLPFPLLCVNYSMERSNPQERWTFRVNFFTEIECYVIDSR
jgi:hypothetical protein